MKLRNLMGWLCLGLVWVGACASSPMEIPETLKNQVDPGITFSQILHHPESYQGKMIMLGGEVLSARRLAEGTRLEVLQLPLDDSQRPVVTRTDSQGRFFAMEKAFLDPAMFPPNTRVTIVGEVTGTIAAKLDEMDYQYPTVVIKHLHVWIEPTMAEEGNSGPWYSIFGGGSTGGRVGGGVGIGVGF
ncbi:MAG: Slp family lipoprotein [Nitrospirota bacterium]|nr:Slp family lipoprotein [Nitrospirota bacterium]MDH4361425.1 Slp family lipoprotein [Nitrospirota bacterium]MDH5574853.1 Slp family lipoprotein [Nitrospirota bacterium]